MSEAEITDKVLDGLKRALAKSRQKDLRWEKAKKQGLTWKQFDKQEQARLAQEDEAELQRLRELARQQQANQKGVHYGQDQQVNDDQPLVPLELLDDPRFQNLYGKAETHEMVHRPKEYALLKKQGKLQQVLQQRTLLCWETLKGCRQAGMSLDAAEDEALPIIYVPTEEDDEEERAERQEE